jgi:prefoldin subunit 5
MIRRQINLIEEKINKLRASQEKFENLLSQLNSLEDKVEKEDV